jgi:glyoxylase-like metal-dependent hydrolase (beta-lactamase superfamily II)
MKDRRRRGFVSRIIRIVGVLIFLAVVLAAFGLAWVHVAIRDENPPLPITKTLAAVGSGDIPIRLSWIETASQRSPAPDAKEGQDEWRRLVHPVFVLEWQDGRVLLVDTGMDADYARAFGRPMEWILGSQPVEVGRSAADALGAARSRLAGIVFTHLHMDHTEGIGLLCRPGAPPFPVFMTPAQSERPNYTTRTGLAQVQAASCARPVALADNGLAPLPGMNGVGVIRAAGHTPGSQLIVVWVGSRQTGRHGYVLAGDVVFEKSQIAEDRPKPLVYRLLITPENDGQLGKVRRWLRDLEAEGEFTVIPSHDGGYLDSLGLPRFDGSAPQ